MKKESLTGAHQYMRDRLINGFDRISGLFRSDVASKPERKGHRKPMIKDEGLKVKNLRCPMCMGYIKVGLQFAKCECGETYHVVCLTRMGYCPVCNKKWDEKNVIDITSTNGDPKSSPYERILECPSCANKVSIYDMECECGAIFVKDNDSFLCPECGGRVGLKDMICMNCGETFRPCDIVVCPECGKRFDALSGPCECGAFVGDACPLCGHDLAEDDISCANCGALIGKI